MRYALAVLAPDVVRRARAVAEAALVCEVEDRRITAYEVIADPAGVVSVSLR